MARPNIFHASLSKVVAGALGGHFLPATLRKFTTTIDSTALTAAPTRSASVYSCKGFLDEYKDYQIDHTLVQRGDRKALLLGGTLNSTIEPAPGDELDIEGRTWDIVSVQRDPAGAIFECQVRG